MAPSPTPRGGGVSFAGRRAHESFALAWVVILAMTGKLITFPLRVWYQSARLLTRATGGAALRVYSLARPAPAPEHRHEPARYEPHHDEPRHDEARVSRHEPSAPPTPDPAPPKPEPLRPLHPPIAEEPVDAAREPVHVSEEPELVRESAEPGAEDGAGAAVNVLEPWHGYAHMTAREVIARARQAGRAELAAVRLYESRHRSRQTVLAAVDRQLKVGNGSAPV